jgi:hypothetical protein
LDCDDEAKFFPIEIASELKFQKPETFAAFFSKPGNMGSI